MYGSVSGRGPGLRSSREAKTGGAVARVSLGLVALLLLLWCPPALAQTLTVTMGQGALDDRRVREAVVSGVDWSALTRAGGPPILSVFLTDGPRLDTQRADRELAARLLLEVDVGPRQPARLNLFHDSNSAAAARALAAELGRLSIIAEPVPLSTDGIARLRQLPSQQAMGTRFATSAYILLTHGPIRAQIIEAILLPDLIIRDLQATPVPDRGVLRLEVTVGNNGLGPVRERGIDVVIHDRAGHLTGPMQLQLQAVVPGASTSRTLEVPVPISALGQTVRLQAQVDPDNAIRETNTDNNLGREVALTLWAPRPERPDLVIGDLRATPFPDRGVLQLEVTVTNIGLAPVRDRMIDVVIRDRAGHLTAPMRLQLSAVGPRASTSGRMEVPVPASALGQTVRLQAHADPDNAIPETTTENNLGREVALTLWAPRPELPDLVLAGMGADWDPLRGDVAVSVTVRNGGAGPAPAHWVRVTDTARLLPEASVQMPELAPGERATRTLRLQVPEAARGGTARLRARADPDGQLREVSRDNNTSAEVQVGLPAVARWDLVVDDLSVSFDPQTRRLRIAAPVRNPGNAPAPPSELVFHDRAGVLPDPLGRADIAGLGPGTETRAGLDLTVPPEALGRSARLQAVATPTGRAVDLATNQSPIVQIAFPAQPAPPVQQPDVLPDLVIHSFEADQLLWSTGLRLQIVVANRGEGSSGPTDLAVHGHRLGQLAHGRVPPLVPGETATVTLRAASGAGLLGGAVRLDAMVDHARIITEADEGNNSSSRNVAVHPPLGPWAGIGAGALGAMVLLGLRVARRGPGQTPDAIRPPPPKPALVAVIDPGRQTLGPPDGGGPDTRREIRLRPVADRGNATLTPLPDLEGMEP